MGNNDNNGKKDKKSFPFTICITLVCFIVVISYALAINNSTEKVGDEILKAKEETKESIEVVDATILGTEAVGGSYSIDYNTYFELKDGSVLRLEDDKVYAYAKFDEGAKVEVEIIEGEIKPDEKRGSVDTTKEDEPKKGEKPKLYVDKYKYISDVLVEGQSIRFLR